MMRKFTFLIIGLSAITEIVNSFDLFAREREFTYKYTGSVVVGAQSQDEDLSPPDSSGWRIEGLLKLQRINQNFMAAKVWRFFLFFFLSFLFFKLLNFLNCL